MSKDFVKKATDLIKTQTQIKHLTRQKSELEIKQIEIQKQIDVIVSN